MQRVIAELTDLADRAATGHFKRANHDTLDAMRQADRDVEHGRAQARRPLPRRPVDRRRSTQLARRRQ